MTAGLQVAQRRGDELAEARARSTTPGASRLARAELEAEGHNLSAARKWRREGQEDLDWACRVYQRLAQEVPEGRLRKYLAQIAIEDGDLAERGGPSGAGEGTLSQAGHGPGLAEVQEFTAYLRLGAEQGRRGGDAAAAGADGVRPPPPAAAGGAGVPAVGASAGAKAKAPKSQIIRAYEEALRRERGVPARRPGGEDRTRAGGRRFGAGVEAPVPAGGGHGVPEAVSSLNEGSSDAVTILCLELAEFEGFCQGLDPESVMWTLNQLLADLQVVLDRHKVHILTYLGGGFLALFREAGHAERAVEAALECATMEEFNRPRGIPGAAAAAGAGRHGDGAGVPGQHRHLSAPRFRGGRPAGEPGGELDAPRGAGDADDQQRDVRTGAPTGSCTRRRARARWT